MNDLDKQYQDLLQDIIDNGVVKGDRTGTGTISLFGKQIRHKMSEGFPLLTTKKMAWKSMVVELLWFLQGGTNIKYLVDNGCMIWVGDAYKNYKKWADEHSKSNLYESYTKSQFIDQIKSDSEFSDKWGELGPIYGKQWRNWGGYKDKYRQQTHTGGSFGGPVKVTYGDMVEYDVPGVDQIKNLINDLKNNPDSRRLMVNAWNVSDIDKMVLPPCHYGFQLYTRDLSIEERCSEYIKRHPNETSDIVSHYKCIAGHSCTHEDYDKWNIPTRSLSLMWNQRSVDTFLGLPFNISSYGLLLMMIADEVNMIPDELIGNLGDTHLYSNHIDAAKEQISRTPYDLPKVHVRDGIECSSINDIILEDYISHGPIKAELSN